MRYLIVPGVALFITSLAACGGWSGHEPGRVSPAAIEAHVRFLADDLLEGREAGTRGYDLAALYVANRFRALGLEPAGSDGSFYQKVPLVKAVRLAEGARFSLRRDEGTIEFRWQEDWLPALRYVAESDTVTAPLVFVGHAVHAPELGYDDFADVDLAGKIAVYFPGAPARFPNDQRAFHSSSREKSQAIESRGAVGALQLALPREDAKYPFERFVKNWARPGMRLIGPDGAPVEVYPGVKVAGSMSLAASQRLFAGGAMRWEEAVAAEETGALKSFVLPGTATLAARWRFERLESANVVGRLPGADGVLASEHVALTAHLDHIGVGAPIEGDAIYNGALDNATGVAALLETAHTLAHGKQRPRRSVLFIALTAEEKGLLGSQYYAEFPTVPVESLVANVNFDMPVILAPQNDVIGIGLEHSSLDAVVREAAAGLGMEISPDPFPDEVVFVRSDQYSFVRRGVPAVYLDGGRKSTDPAVDMEAVLQDFLRQHYHQPSDDLTRPIHWESVARLADLNGRVALAIANAPARPTWNEGDFFGERFGRRVAR